METAEQIKALREAAIRSLSVLHERAAPLLKDIERKQKEIALLDDLLRLHAGQDGQVQETSPSVRPPRVGRTNASIVENAKRILAEAGRPLHITELKRVFLEHGIPIPGQGKEANLIAHLRRNSEIVRVKRGFYTLADTTSDQVAPQPTIRKRRGKRRRRAARKRDKVLEARGVPNSHSASSQSEPSKPGQSLRLS
jgi:hypothetical protein